MKIIALLFGIVCLLGCRNSEIKIVEGKEVVQTDSARSLSSTDSFKEGSNDTVLSPPDNVAADTLWQHKKKTGIDFFGIGNEPFWNIEIDEQKQTTIRMADWQSAVVMQTPIPFSSSKDSIVYRFNDADATVVVLYNQPCSDGMSDRVYAQKIKLQYKKQLYSGCGKLFRKFY